MRMQLGPGSTWRTFWPGIPGSGDKAENFYYGRWRSNMSRLFRLKEKLKNREPVLGTTITGVKWSGLVQKAAQYPLDFILFDLEHGTLSIEGIEESLRICRLTDLPSIVRVPDSVPNIISKTLDMGADGLLLPRIEKAEQVEIAVRAARYFPRGRKGCGGFSNFRPEDESSTDRYNDNRMIFIQMESDEGLKMLPSILSKFKAELSGVIIGPYDASIMYGTPLNIKSDVIKNFIKKVFSICRQENISCGIFVDNRSMIQGYRELGANIFWVGSEISFICESYAALCESFKEAIEE
jgi:4-hydroxy-2-oxoheptanedioate aldolase